MSDDTNPVDPRLVAVIEEALVEADPGTGPPHLVAVTVARQIADAVWAWLAEGD